MRLESTRVRNSERARIQQATRIVWVCVGVALVYPILAREFDDPVGMLNGFLIGLIGGIAIAAHQDYLAYSPRLKQLPFVTSIILITLGYTLGFAVLVLGVIGTTRGLESGEGVINYITGDEFREFLLYEDFILIMLWALCMSFMLSFSFRMRTKVAGNILHNMIFGKYARPKEEYRTIMFIDLNDATSIAESVSQDEYFRFLNDFYVVITPAITSSGGDIYRYVGDQMTVSWLMRKAFDPLICIQSIMRARDSLELKREHFIRHYGIMPSFKASLHCGPVIIGELGDVKSQLVFHGDVMYVTEGIESCCRKFGVDLLVSEDVMNRTELPPLYEKEYCGDMQLNEEAQLKLYTISEKTILVPE